MFADYSQDERPFAADMPSPVLAAAFTMRGALIRSGPWDRRQR